MPNEVPQQLGNYILTRRIGEGGFATVYLARHIYLNSYAAVKILHAQFGIPEIDQFRQEAAMIADLAHPNIVHVLDFDVQDDIAFLVMDYAPFGSLRQQYKPGTHVPLPAIISYTNQIATALQYAHLHRIIHRDVKPANMLIGKDFRILLSDFGIALLADSSRFSRQHTRDAVGTIAYIAPEQINGRPRPASDQYSLAVCVYEWLCGRRPFTGTMTEITAKHLSAQPPPLHMYAPNVSDDVEAVVIRALSKDPAQRFQTVQEFAEALEDASGVEPRAPQKEDFTTIPIADSSSSSRLILRSSDQDRREVSRMPTVLQQDDPIINSRRQSRMPRRAILFGALGLIGVAGTSVAFAALRHTPPPLQNAVGHITQGGTAAANPTLTLTNAATPTPAPTNATSPIATPTDAAPTQPPTPTQAPQPQPNLAPVGTTLAVYQGHTATVYGVSWSPDGTRVVSCDANGTAQVWHAADGGAILTYRGHTQPVTFVAWSPDGRRIASASDDRTIQIWDAITGNLMVTCSGHASSVHGIAWSPDSSRIVSASSDNTARIWDTTTGNTLTIYRDHHATVWDADWSHDGTRIASSAGSPGAQDNTVKVWNLATGATTVTYTGHTGIVLNIAWSPDNRRIASGSGDTTVQVWSAATGTTQRIFRGHTDTVYGVSWSPDGNLVASGSADKTVQIWDVAQNTTRFTYRGHSSFVFGVVWSPDGTRIASASDDKTVQIWQA